jgi:colanic acid/amylovoran biosynthesis glycosyltransferase
MKIAAILIRFPTLTETFILNRITGLMDRGCEVDLFAWTNERISTIQPDIRKYNLLERIHFFGGFRTPPRTPLFYFLGALWLILKNIFNNPWPLLKCLKYLLVNPVFSLRLLYAASSFLKRESYDIIHCNYGESGLYFLQLKKILGLRGKIVTSFHGYDVSRYTQLHGEHVYDELFAEADLFFAVSESIRQRLIQLGCDERKVIVHHSGIDLKRFKSGHQKTGSRKTTNIISVGFTEKKGLEYGIRAVGRLVDAGYNPHYYIVGDGGLRERLQLLIGDLKLEDIVTLCGYKNQEELVGLLEKSDFMIAPSITTDSGDQEGIPNVLKEAMAMGLPVISTRHAGIPELVHDGVSGFLVPERDIYALTERMAFLIQHPENAAEMGKNGCLLVKQEYDIDTLNDRLVQYYKSLLC